MIVVMDSSWHIHDALSCFKVIIDCHVYQIKVPYLSGLSLVVI